MADVKTGRRIDGPWWAAAAVAMGFGVLGGLSMWGLNPAMDEMTDLVVMASLVEHPPYGNGVDASQARLPMMLSLPAAAVIEIVNPAGAAEQQIVAARIVALLMSASAVLLTFVLGRRWFGTATGLWAAGLLAVSPYFLGFGRLAMTEGDAFCPLATLGVLWAFDRFDRHRGASQSIVLGLMLGLGIATKFLLVVLLPILGGYQLLAWCLKRNGARPLEDREQGERKLEGVARGRGPTAWWVLVVAAVLGFAALGGVAVGQVTEVAGHGVAVACWLVCLGGLLVLLGMLPRWRGGIGAWRERLLGAGAAQPWWLRWCVVFALSGVVSLTLAPAHMLQPMIFSVSADRADTWDGGTLGAGAWEAARLYLGVALLKMGWPMGMLSVLALGWAWVAGLRGSGSGHNHFLRRGQARPMDAASFRGRDDFRGLLLLAVVLTGWAVVLGVLPLQQPFYPMSVYPLLCMVLAGAIIESDRWLRRRVLAGVWAWRAGVAAAVLLLVVGTARSYPMFNYFGYETVGDRWLGGPTRGARSLIRVTNDGVLDALEWTARSTPAGARVVVVSYDMRTLSLLSDAERDAMGITMVGGWLYADYAPLLEEADVLIVGLQSRTRLGNAPPEPTLSRLFGPPAHVIERGRGPYRMPVAEIYFSDDL